MRERRTLFNAASVFDTAPMFSRLGNFVSRHWALVIFAWIALLAVVSSTAPRWDEVTHDGDFAFLPPSSTTIQAEALLEEAFPARRSKSQIVVIVSRRDAQLTTDDLESVAYDIGRRLQNLYAVAILSEADELERLQREAEGAGDATRATELELLVSARRQEALGSLEEAIHLDASWSSRVTERRFEHRQLAEAYHNRAHLYGLLDQPALAEADRQVAERLDAQMERDHGPDELLPAIGATMPLLELWTWRDADFGAKLRSDDRRARLMVMHLTREFLEVRNMELVRHIESEVADVRASMLAQGLDHLEIGVAGSATVGGDLLMATKSSIEHTELYTLILVVLILAAVYRAPLLIIIPLLTIFFSLRISMGIVALLTRLHEVPGLGWWQLKVFTTSKIFIVVILFGAGTDFCLFLISRWRECLRQGLDHPAAAAAALANVGEALTASALTTIIGLSMMIFAEFGKFRYSGPVIGLCLAVTLAACLTLTPALLRALGSLLHARPPETTAPSRHLLRIWSALARGIVARPGLVLACTATALAPLAILGVRVSDDLTYDLVASLDREAPSRQGARLMRANFPIGEAGPVTVVALRPDARFNSESSQRQIADLNWQLRDVEGVETVRSFFDPLGNCQVGESASVFSPDAWQARVVRLQDRTKQMYVAQEGPLAGSVTRFDVVLMHDPFSIEAVEVLERMQQRLAQVASQEGTFWSGARFFFAGTTAGISDLRRVTRADSVRIELLVVLAVLLVLIVMLRRPLISLYLILSVLLTYFVTMGITATVFHWSYGADYQGLDWKVPLYLFVILVAIGQDYNVYLLTRVFEEQRTLGYMEGLREAIVRTGGIISSCGVIMAGTFISMTSGVWGQVIPLLPAGRALQGVVQLGFALALGVVLDTFIVRPIMVPAFLALLGKTAPAAEAAEPYSNTQPAQQTASGK